MLHRTFIFIFSFLLLFTYAAAQVRKGILKKDEFELIDKGELTRLDDESFQGLAIYKRYMVSLYNKGIANVYQLSGNGDFTLVNSFRLGSYGKYNHANVADFGTERFAKDDILPLLYVSQTKTDKDNGLTDACFVERIQPLEGKAVTVQTITLEDHDKYYGWAVQWNVDRKRRLLIGFGNTVNNTDPKNQFRIMVFRLPKLKEGSRIVLKAEDAKENYLIQDYDPSFPHIQIGQGATVEGGLLIMPTGTGAEQYPSVIYSWDLRHHRMASRVNMQKLVPYELEDCSFYRGQLYVQCNKGKAGRMLVFRDKR